MLDAGGHKFELSYRMIDTFSLGHSFYGIENTDQLFEFFGIDRGHHAATEDIRLSAEMYRLVRQAGNRKLIAAGRLPAGVPAYAQEFTAWYIQQTKHNRTFGGVFIYFDAQRQKSYRWREHYGTSTPHLL